MNLANKTLAFIGAGNMAEALIRGLVINKTVAAARIIATDVREERLEYLQREFQIRVTGDNTAAVREADLVILAVKPQQMSSVLSGLLDAITGNKLVISIAAGVPTDRIERELGGQARVIRVMPNTPSLVGAGAAGLARGRHATTEDLQLAEAIVKAVGIVVPVEEEQLDAITALSGSGPAYVFLLAEAMIRAGIEQGLPAEVSRKLTVHTIFGAAILMAETGAAPEDLRAKVTSPGGTTEAAIRVMLQGRLPETVREAIAAAAQRSRQLRG